MAKNPLLDQHQEILDRMIGDDEDQKDLGTGGENETIETDDDDDIKGDTVEDEDQNNDSAGDDDTSDDDASTGPVARQPAADDEEKLQLGYKADRHGNLVDKDGKVLFTAGRARGVFEKMKKAIYNEQNKNKEIITAFNQTASAAKELFARYKALKEQANQGKTLGLTDNEMSEAAEIRALMKLDPKAGVRKILTMLHLNGTDLSDIGVNGPLDAKTVAEHMLQLQEAQRPKEPDPEASAREEAQAFIKRHPDAQPHTGLVAQAKLRYPHMTLDQIWFEIKAAANRGGGKQQQQKPQERAPGRVIPRNSSAPAADKGKKLSLKAVDPTKSFNQIGRDLLRDLKSLED